MLGGRASPVQLRAAIAWAGMPVAASSPIYCFVLVGLKLYADDAGDAASRNVIEILLAVGGLLVLWSLVAMTFMLARVQGFEIVRTLVNFGLGLLLLLAISLIFRTFIVQPFSMPSGSMKPILLVGDQFFVSKFSYGYTRYSLPFSLQLFSGRIFAAQPKRGDVAVFRLPSDDSVDYVKRVIGLPGDRVQMIRGVLNINGVPVAREQLGDFAGEAPCPTTSVSEVTRWRETLPNGASYETIVCADDAKFPSTTEVYVVPPGDYFMMGDNRDNSLDSRMLSRFGYIPFGHIVGRASMIFLSIEQEDRRRSSAARFERFGMAIR